jgi:hypothetical protein
MTRQAVNLEGCRSRLRCYERQEARTGNDIDPDQTDYPRECERVSGLDQVASRAAHPGGVFGSPKGVNPLAERETTVQPLEALQGSLPLLCRERDDPIVMRLCASHDALAPIPNHASGSLHGRPVVTVEWSSRHIIIELGPIDGDPRRKNHQTFSWAVRPDFSPS